LVIAAALAVAGVGAATAAGAQAVQIELRPGEVLLKVEAQGEDRSRPDVVTIVAGAVTAGGTAREALQTNNALATRLIEAARASGVQPADVRTVGLSVTPRFNPGEDGRAEMEGRRPRITGYVATNEVELRLRDVGRAGDVVGALFAAGANQVRGPDFSHSDPKPAQDRARRDAVTNAQAEASAYADALGMRVSRVLRVSQRGSFDEDERNVIVVTGSRMSRAPIEPGEISTRVKVWVDYALLPR
jgi:uncharacterized protein YggE